MAAAEAVAALRHEHDIFTALLSCSKRQHGPALYFRKLDLARRQLSRALALSPPPDATAAGTAAIELMLPTLQRAQALMRAAFCEVEDLLAQSYFMPFALVSLACVSRLVTLCACLEQTLAPAAATAAAADSTALPVTPAGDAPACLSVPVDAALLSTARDEDVGEAFVPAVPAVPAGPAPAAGLAPRTAGGGDGTAAADGGAAVQWQQPTRQQHTEDAPVGADGNTPVSAPPAHAAALPLPAAAPAAAVSAPAPELASCAPPSAAPRPHEWLGGGGERRREPAAPPSSHSAARLRLRGCASAHAHARRLCLLRSWALRLGLRPTAKRRAGGAAVGAGGAVGAAPRRKAKGSTSVTPTQSARRAAAPRPHAPRPASSVGGASAGPHPAPHAAASLHGAAAGSHAAHVGGASAAPGGSPGRAAAEPDVPAAAAAGSTAAADRSQPCRPSVTRARTELGVAPRQEAADRAGANTAPSATVPAVAPSSNRVAQLRAQLLAGRGASSR